MNGKWLACRQVKRSFETKLQTQFDVSLPGLFTRAVAMKSWYLRRLLDYANLPRTSLCTRNLRYFISPPGRTIASVLGPAKSLTRPQQSVLQTTLADRNFPRYRSNLWLLWRTERSCHRVYRRRWRERSQAIALHHVAQFTRCQTPDSRWTNSLHCTPACKLRTQNLRRTDTPKLADSRRGVCLVRRRASRAKKEESCRLDTQFFPSISDKPSVTIHQSHIEPRNID